MDENPKETASFFYDLDQTSPFFFLWSKETATYPKNLPDFPVLCKGTLFKKGKTLKLTKARTYYLTESYLYYKEREDSKKIKGVLEFRNVLLRTKSDEASKKPIYFLKLQRNNSKTTLYTFDRELFEKFRELLEKVCILDSFQKDFSLIKLIGKGSFAKVYLALSSRNREYFAVKAFYKEIVSKQSHGRESLVNEIAILRRLAGFPDILHLFSVYESRNSVYFVLNLIEGGELLGDLKPERPETHYKEAKIAEILEGVLQALAKVHEKRVIHRDLKPENILLTKKSANSQGIIIADFGLATFCDEKLKNVVFKRCGTPGYVAPEVLNYKENEAFYDTVSDMFGVGVIFYIMITNGTRPFKGFDLQDTLSKNKKAVVDYSRPNINKLTQPGRDLLKKLLAADPKQRISCLEALKHPFFKLSRAEHDAGWASPEEEEEEKKIDSFLEVKQENPAQMLASAFSTQKLLQSPSNNFEHLNNCVNGKIATIQDSSKMLSSKNEEEMQFSSKKSAFLQGSFSRFSRIPQSPGKTERETSILGGFSSKNLQKPAELFENSAKNRASLSPTKKKLAGNEIYRLALMNNKKKAQNP